MNSLRILLAASLLLALTPSAHASDCWKTPASEGMAHPLKAGSYLLIDATDPTRSGEWVETNGLSGLQTLHCMTFGVYRYGADTKAPILP